MTISTALGQFAGTLRGQLIQPADPEYDNARRVWNAMIDKRPALIVRPAVAEDIVAAVNFARDNDLSLSVRGGGHNMAGLGVGEGGLMIDLSLMKDLRVDPVRRTAIAQAGLKLGEFDRGTQAFGLATTMGVATDTGIAGLTLGGGYGWLAGKYGLACDNLLSVDVVTAEGKIVHASEDENADLFWGIRGGGGNFGIVTSFEYTLHPVKRVVGGLAIYPMSTEAVRFFDEFSNTCPDEMSTTGLLATAPDGTPAVVIVACHCGPLEEAETAFKPLRAFGPALADMIEPREYVEMQEITDQNWPPGNLYYWKSSLIRTLNDESIETLVEQARRKPTASSVIYIQQLHGAAGRVDPMATAFPHRYDHYNCGSMFQTEDPAADTGQGIQWSRDCWEAMRPFVESSNYVNDLVEVDEQRVREAYGPNYARLVELKNKYDPTNFFRLNANIKPTV